MKKIVLAASVALVLAGCGSSTTSETATSQQAATAEAAPTTPPQENPVEEASARVDWTIYAPTVKQQIDAAAAAGDCAGLQSQFDTADANNEATAARTGTNNANLMGYIDAQMQAAGCYDN